MTLNDLLQKAGIEPSKVLVMRHKPPERDLGRVFQWLAAERPDVFNAYQQTQGPRLEAAMARMTQEGYVASFIGHEPGKALFVGLYSIGEAKPITKTEYWNLPAYVELRKFGHRGFAEGDHRDAVLWFDLALEHFYSDWKGKLIIGWPGREIAWWRRAHNNELPVLAITEENTLEASMPNWDQINWTWSDLAVLPRRWRDALSHWRCIYYIFDKSDRKGYVGSAYGQQNLYGRWTNYGADGHGGNRLLRGRNPTNFCFTVLQRVSPDMPPDEIISLENSWKERLHSRHPLGLNDN